MAVAFTESCLLSRIFDLLADLAAVQSRQTTSRFPTAAQQASPTWRIGPAFQLFSRHKLLIFRGGVPRKVSKPAVVKTPPVPKSAPMCIIDSCYVPALHDAKEKRQRAPLL